MYILVAGYSSVRLGLDVTHQVISLNELSSCKRYGVGVHSRGERYFNVAN